MISHIGFCEFGNFTVKPKPWEATAGSPSVGRGPEMTQFVTDVSVRFSLLRLIFLTFEELILHLQQSGEEPSLTVVTFPSHDDIGCSCSPVPLSRLDEHGGVGFFCCFRDIKKVSCSIHSPL